MSNITTVAAVQMTSGTDTDANLAAAADGLERAAEGGASLAVLPENFAGYGVDYRVLAERHEALCQWLGERARALGLWVLGGSLPALTRPDGAAVPAPQMMVTTKSAMAAIQCFRPASASGATKRQTDLSRSSAAFRRVSACRVRNT